MKKHWRLFFRIFDLFSILVALEVSAWFMLPPDWSILEDYTGASFFTVLTFFLAFYTLDCYRVGREDFKDSFIRLVMAVALGIICTGFIFYTFEHWRFPRLTFIIQLGVILFLTLSWRYAYYRISKRGVRARGKLLFLGVDMAGRAKRLLAEHMPELEIAGYVGAKSAATDESGPWQGDIPAVLDVVGSLGVNHLLILDPAALDQDLARRLFQAKLRGLRVDDMRSLYERLASRLPIDFIKEDWLLLDDGFNMAANEATRRVKRAFDICVSLGLLLVLWPLVLLAALAIRLDSPGAAVFKQKRVGQNGREFVLYKLRSMRLDAEKDGARWASEGDPRVTRTGRFLRKSRIDELPQLWNVLMGDMSLIGPRPERMEFVRELEQKLPFYGVRHTVKPGVTGWAQVCYPYGASLEDSRYKLEYDLYYIKHLSPLLETKIVLRTIGVILFPRGAR